MFFQKKSHNHSKLKIHNSSLSFVIAFMPWFPLILLTNRNPVRSPNI